jgi:RNA polymerase sigma-70 factor (ECF subfamily)
MLTPEDNFLLSLYYFKELSTAEISIIIATSSNNVKVKLYRSRKRLALILKKQLEPELIECYVRKNG